MKLAQSKLIQFKFAFTALWMYISFRWNKPKMWFYQPKRRLRSFYSTARLNHLLRQMQNQGAQSPTPTP